MQEELLNRLDTFAGQLGIAVEHIYGALLLQAPLEWVEVVILGAIATVSFVVSFFSLRSWAKKDWGEDVVAFSSIVGVVLCAGATLCMLVEATEAFKATMNPDYYALNILRRFF